MPRNHFARLSVILLVVAALAAPPAWGAPRPPSGGIDPIGILAHVWSSLSALWSEEGCNADPHGGCGTSQLSTPNAGCTLDPHGGCATAQQVVPPPTPDEGCNLDPHGGCAAGN